MSIEVRIDHTGSARDTVAAVHDIVSGPRGRSLMAVLGKTHERTLQDHFAGLEQQPNKRGWQKQHFWAQIRRATSFVSASQRAATVAVSDPRLATHIHGATIRPRRSKYLAIPMRPEAYGIRPSSGLIADLFVIRSRKNKLYLARTEGNALRAYYRLLRSVTIPAKPDALPPEPVSIAAITDAADAYISRAARRAANQRAN